MNARSKNINDTHAFINAVSGHQGWKLNPDTGFVADLADGLTSNYNRFGYYLCPCRDGDGDRAADRDIICPCTYAPEDILEHGRCFCALFLSASFDGSPAPIPERRPYP